MPSTGAGPTFLPGLDEPLGGVGDRLPGLEEGLIAGLGVSGDEAHGRPALVDVADGVVDGVRAHRRAGGDEAGDVVSLRAAEELVYGDAEAFGDEVVERDVYR